MGLLLLIILIAVVSALVPIGPQYQKLLYVVAVVLTIIWLASLFGLISVPYSDIGFVRR